MQYVIITGRKVSHHQPSLQAYVAHIVYGCPNIRVVESGEMFVALCEYEDDTATARATFERMPSFSYGTLYTKDRDVAMREFGTWAYHYGDRWPTWDEGAEPEDPELAAELREADSKQAF